MLSSHISVILLAGDKMDYKILVVEDDQDIQELIKEFLKAQNYQVDTAADGVLGISLFQKHDYDLVILDVMLPNLDGHSVCKMIRNKSSVPIIMLTALGEEKDHVKGFELGVDDYITKPFSFTIFMKRVEAVLRRTYGEGSSRLQKCKEVVANYDSYTVTVNELPIDLTTKEFEILYILMENRGRVLTREMILDKAWGYDYFGDLRVVDTHIKNLRKKLGITYIKTIKGIG